MKWSVGLLIGIADYIGNSPPSLKKAAALENSSLYLTFSVINVEVYPLLFHEFSFNYFLTKNSSEFLTYLPKISKKNSKKTSSKCIKPKISTNFHQNLQFFSQPFL